MIQEFSVRKLVLSIVVSSLMLLLPTEPYAQQDNVEMRTSSGEFEDISQAVEDAIINRGYVIDYHGYIGEMLKRTAADVGAEKSLYENAEFFSFCSAVLSRKMMEVDIGNIAYCPYVIFVYSEAEASNTVSIGFRRLPEGSGRDQINELLSEIVTEAADGL